MARARSSPRLVVLTHVVRKGESLSKIALLYDRPVSAWRDLFTINKSVLAKAQGEHETLPEDGEPNPNLIYPGTILRLPSGWGAARSEEAQVQVRLSDEGRRVAWFVGGLFALGVLAVSAFSRRKRIRLRESVAKAHAREEAARLDAPPEPDAAARPGELHDLDALEA